MSGLKKRKSRRSEEEWREIVERCEGSPLSQSKFCLSEGIALSSLQKWKRRLEGESSFIPLSEGVRGAEEYQLEIELPSGMLIRLR